MPDFTSNPNEPDGQFALRMKKKLKPASLSRAAGRFLQTKEGERPDKTQQLKY